MFRSALCLAGFLMMSGPVAAQIISDQDPPQIFNCGAQIASIVKVMPSDRTLMVERTPDFAPVPFAYAIIRVPPATTQCIKVVFKGQGGCAADFCNIAVTAGRYWLSGGWGLKGLWFGNGVHEWVGRVGPGTHRVQLHVMVFDESSDPPTPPEYLWLRSWVLDVSSYR